MDKSEVLKEFADIYCKGDIACKDCEHVGICMPNHFISDLLDEAEKEKHEAVQLGYDKAHKEIAKAYIEIEEKELNK